MARLTSSRWPADDNVDHHANDPLAGIAQGGRQAVSGTYSGLQPFVSRRYSPAAITPPSGVTSTGTVTEPTRTKRSTDPSMNWSN